MEPRFQGTRILDERIHLPEGLPWHFIFACPQELDSFEAGGGVHQIAVDATEDNIYATFLGNAGGQRTGGQGSVRRFTRE